MLLPVVWVACAAVIVTSAVRVRHHPATALRTARAGMAVLFLFAGAAVNAAFLARGDDYSGFADGAYIPYVRNTWESLVVPNHDIFISALVAFELAVGLLALLGGSRTQLAYAAAVAFHLALLSFGWGFYLWSVPMVVALTVLLQRGAPLRRAPPCTHDPGEAGESGGCVT